MKWGVNLNVRLEVLMVILFAGLKEIVICRIFFTKFTWPKKNFQFELVESRYLKPSFFYIPDNLEPSQLTFTSSQTL